MVEDKKKVWVLRNRNAATQSSGSIFSVLGIKHSHSLRNLDQGIDMGIQFPPIAFLYLLYLFIYVFFYLFIYFFYIIHIFVQWYKALLNIKQGNHLPLQVPQHDLLPL